MAAINGSTNGVLGIAGFAVSGVRVQRWPRHGVSGTRVRGYLAFAARFPPRVLGRGRWLARSPSTFLSVPPTRSARYGDNNGRCREPADDGTEPPPTTMLADGARVPSTVPDERDDE